MKVRVDSVLLLSFVMTQGVLSEAQEESVLDRYPKMLGEPYFPLKYEYFFDQLNIPQVFKHERYVKFLLKCVFFSKPCDIIGKFLKRKFFWLNRFTVRLIASGCV